MASGLTIDNPAKLSQVLVSTKIIPGDTIWLRGGTYTIGSGKGYQNVSIAGTEALPVVIRNFPGESVRIDGGLDLISGSKYLTIRGIEIASTPTTRIFEAGREAETDYPTGLRNFYGVGCKLINCIIHDVRQGSEPMGVSPFEMYGCLVYNQGWEGSDGGRTGYGVYSHNDPELKMTFKHNIFAGGFGVYSLHLNSAGNSVANYDILGNVLMFAGMVFSTATKIDNELIDDNHFVHCAARLGQHGFPAANLNAVFTNNRTYQTGIASGIGIYDMQDRTVTGNTWVNGAYIQEVATADNLPVYPGTQDYNTYHYVGTNPSIKNNPFRLNGINYSFDNWKVETGWDAHSTFDYGAPTVNEVVCYANEYADQFDIRVGSVIIWNWHNDDTITDDLSELSLTVGSTYRWRQVQDPYGDTGTFVYNGSVSFDMRAASHTVAIPTAYAEPVNVTSFPVFGAFIIEKA